MHAIECLVLGLMHLCQTVMVGPFEATSQVAEFTCALSVQAFLVCNQLQTGA